MIIKIMVTTLPCVSRWKDIPFQFFPNSSPANKRIKFNFNELRNDIMVVRYSDNSDTPVKKNSSSSSIHAADCNYSPIPVRLNPCFNIINFLNRNEFEFSGFQNANVKSILTLYTVRNPALLPMVKRSRESVKSPLSIPASDPTPPSITSLGEGGNTFSIYALAPALQYTRTRLNAAR
jgi:hypothetical protein